MKRFGYILLSVLVLAACSSTPTPPPGPPSPPTGPANPTPPGPGTPTPPADDGRCAVQVADDITIATTWVNTPSNCDYEVNGVLSVSNGQLTIEPGVLVRFGQDAYISFSDAGSLYAVGTPQQRIVFEGASAVKGFGKGLYFRSGSYASRIDYADLRYLGKLDEGYYKFQNAAISGFNGGELSLTNSTVSGSNFFGAELDRDSLVLTEFANNQFFDNAQEGLKVSPEAIPLLDAATDYLGAAQPNGEPYIWVGGFSAELGGETVWRNVGAPYTFTNLYLEYGSTTLEPGVEIVLQQGGHFVIEYGALNALGTAEQPIIFRGVNPGAGFWESIELRESEGVFDHVQISGGGLASIVTNSSVDVDESIFTISNSSITDSANYGITCSGYSFSPASLTVAENVSFSNVEWENYVYDEDCAFSGP